MDEPVRHNYRIPLHVLVLAAFGGAGGWLAVAIDSPAIADGIDIIAFVILSLLAGWAFLALLPRLRQLPGAWRDARAGILLPVLMKEMRQTMRGKRMPSLMLASVGLAIAGLAYIVAQWSDYGVYSYEEDAARAADIGGGIIRIIFLLGVILVLLLAPALTAGAISQEREKGTLELLLLTRMSPGQIAWGKLLAGLSVLGLLLLCALPVAGIGFMLGGVAGWQLPAAMAMLACAALCFGAIGLWCSTRFQRTAVAMAVAYALCILLVAVIPLVTDFVIPLILLFIPSEHGGDDSLTLEWLSLIGTIAAIVLFSILISLSCQQRLSCKVRFTIITFCLLIFIFVIGYLMFEDHLASILPLSSFATEDWTGYIEYIDPILAFGILLEPSGYFEYFLPTGEGYYAEFHEDWPIIFSNLAVFLLITKLMLALAGRELRRARAGDRSKWQSSGKPAPPVTSEPGG